MMLRVSIVNFLSFLFLAHSYSQSPKIAVFDLDSMVRALPEYETVDSLLRLFADSAMVEYDALTTAYNKMYYDLGDYSRDQKTLDSINDRNKQLAFTIIYWKSIIEEKTAERRRLWSRLLYEKVNAAFEKVIANKNYDLILKPTSIEIGTNVENLFLDVAKELHLRSLPNNLFYANTRLRF